jgi:hypothetical protein
MQSPHLNISVDLNYQQHYIDQERKYYSIIVHICVILKKMIGVATENLFSSLVQMKNLLIVDLSRFKMVLDRGPMF